MQTKEYQDVSHFYIGSISASLAGSIASGQFTRYNLSADLLISWSLTRGEKFHCRCSLTSFDFSLKQLSEDP